MMWGIRGLHEKNVFFNLKVKRTASHDSVCCKSQENQSAVGSYMKINRKKKDICQEKK